MTYHVDASPWRIKNQNLDSFWVPQGRSVKVGRFTIPDGLMYVGCGLSATSQYTGIESAIIDPSLEIASQYPVNPKGERLYYPSYNRMTPASRLAYLQWLSNGKINPEVNIGYVFLYFYDLERHLLFNMQLFPSPKTYTPALINEVKRLLSIYKRDMAFKLCASKFIQIAQFLFNNKPAYHYTPTYETNGTEYPPDVCFALSSLVVDKKPIPSNWALAWYLGCPETSLRIRAIRSKNEFRQLFQIKYKKQYGDGLVLKRNQTQLRLYYHPASSSNSDRYTPIPVDHLPDITKQKRPMKKLAEIAENCYKELELYNRWIAKNPIILTA